MKRLVRLPNGNWVHPDQVRSVRALDDTDLMFGGYCPPRVIVDHGGGCSELIECTSMKAACAMRDKIVLGLYQSVGVEA